MSKKLFILPAILLVASMMFVTSCGKDCKFDQADYAGTYVTSEDCSASLPAAYAVIILAGTTETDVKITNVWDKFIAGVNATIDCETISIPRQEPDGDQYFVEGSGFIEKNDGVTTITLSYTVSDESVTPIAKDECTQTIYIKQ
jgi:hypothetical protein